MYQETSWCLVVVVVVVVVVAAAAAAAAVVVPRSRKCNNASGWTLLSLGQREFNAVVCSLTA